MRKLNNVTYTHSNRITQQAKDELLIPEEFSGSIAIETWQVNGKIKRKGVCVVSITDYLLGLGEFKDVPIEQEYFIYVCEKCGLQLEEKIMGEKCPDCGEWTYYKDCQKKVVIATESVEEKK